MPNTRIYLLHALSPTHAGIGRGVGYIDLPIDRDGITGWPIIRGSAFKGVWADYHGATDTARKKDTTEGRILKAAFGIADGDNSNSGALMPTDAQLVCLPVRSFRGTFAWCTSPLCLQILQRTLALAGLKELPDRVPAPKEQDDRTKQPGEACCVGETLLDAGWVYLEDLDFKAVSNDKSTGEWAEFIAKSVFLGDTPWQEQFKKRFVVLPETAFDFLCETGTEVHTRVKIDDECKVVEHGKLWTEETLPAETILSGIVHCDRVFQKNGAKDDSIKPDDLLKRFATSDPQQPLVLQIGGKATVGRGQMRCVFTAVSGGGQ
jgi:CRISPR-associated protein Cmr4